MMGIDDPIDSQLEEITSFIIDMANLDFREPPEIRGDGPLDAVLVGLTALGEELQASVVAKEEAEAANLAKASFLANISHELRTPLTTILGSTELLSLTQTNPQQLKLVQQVLSSTLTLQRLVTDLLDFSRIDEGFLRLKSQPFSVQQSLTSVVNQHRAHAQKKSLSLIFESKVLTEETVIGDAGRVEQIFHNIIGNSIKYTTTGLINVSLDVELAEQFAHVVVDIKDTGPGIAIDKQDFIFERFSQVDTSLSRTEPGVGLGLSISRALARKMAGDITVTSVLGEGSTFSISMKLERSKSIPTVAPLASHPTHQQQRILIVDDNDAVRETTAQMLKSLGCTVTGVSNGDDAIEKLHDNAFDLVLMDCQMPGMDGITTTKKALSLLKPPPRIIALTAHATEMHRNMCSEAGMIGYLSKPFRLSDLSDLINKYR